MLLLTVGEGLNQFVTPNSLHGSSGLSEVLNPSSQLLYNKNKNVRQSDAVLESVGRSKLNFEASDDWSEHGSGPTPGEYVAFVFPSLVVFSNYAGITLMYIHHSYLNMITASMHNNQNSESFSCDLYSNAEREGTLCVVTRSPFSNK